MEYTLAGAKVNLAARLMQAASKRVAEERRGVILVELETFSPCSDIDCDWVTLAAIMVKGKSEPVPRPCRSLGPVPTGSPAIVFKARLSVA